MIKQYLVGLSLFISVSTGWASTVPLPTHVSQFAFGSCAKERKPQPIWDTIISSQPELFLFIGDNQYADYQFDGERHYSAPVTDPARLLEAYTVLGNKPGFTKLRQSTPILATWDDHDYGANDMGNDYPLREQSQQYFLDFFGFSDDDPIRQQKGIYHSRIVGPVGQRVQFIMLDTRYHRDPLIKNPAGRPRGKGPYYPMLDTSKTMLGEEQWAWLESTLKEPADIRFIISSIQVVAHEHSWESWGTMPHERQRLFNLIAKTKADGVIFLSGDRHLTEVSVDTGQSGMQVPYPMWDFTASGMTDDYRAVNEDNQYRLGRVYRGSHFGKISIEWAQPTKMTRVELTAVALNGEALYSESVLLSDLAIK